MMHHIHSHKHLLGTPPQKAEAALRRIMADTFQKQKKDVLENLSRLSKKPDGPILSDSWNESIVGAIRPVVLDVYRAGGSKALASIRKFPKKQGKKSYSGLEVMLSTVVEKARIELPEWLDDPDVLEAIDAEMFKFADKINDTTAEMLREELYDGMEAGEGIAELEERISEICDEWSEGNRAEMIARTESARAYSNGHIAAWKATGVVKNKVWVAAADACPFCLDMNGTVIPLDDTFMDEGEDQDIEWGGKDITMSQEYSDVEGPPLHPNCRCALVGQLEEDAGDEEKGLLQKGDFEGHPFRGNQYKDSATAAMEATVVAMRTKDPKDHERASRLHSEAAALAPKKIGGYNQEARMHMGAVAMHNSFLTGPLDQGEELTSVKGDLQGHEFRGNQWRDGSGTGELHHGTSDVNLQAIMERGIAPDVQNRVFEDSHYSGDRGKAVYLTETNNSAKFYASKARQKMGGTAIVLHIKPPADAPLKVAKDKTDDFSKRSFYTAQTIPSDWIVGYDKWVDNEGWVYNPMSATKMSESVFFAPLLLEDEKSITKKGETE